MTALLPSLQAENVRRSLVDYLSTTFALADSEPRRALAEFLENPTDGIFKGPYVRLRACLTWFERLMRHSSGCGGGVGAAVGAG